MSGPQPGWKVMGCWGTLTLLYPIYIQSISIYILLFCSVESFNIHGKRPVRRCCQVLPHLDDLHELPPRPERSGERLQISEPCRRFSLVGCALKVAPWPPWCRKYWIYMDLYGSIGFSDRNLESKLAEHLCVQIEVSLLRRHHRPRNGGRCSAQHPRFCWYFFAYAAKTCEDSADKICFRVRD